MAPKPKSDPGQGPTPKLRRSQRAAPIEESESEQRYRNDEDDDKRQESHAPPVVPADPSFAANVAAKAKRTVYRKPRFDDEVEEISDVTSEDISHHKSDGKIELSSAHSVTGMTFSPPALAFVPEQARSMVRPKGRLPEDDDKIPKSGADRNRRPRGGTQTGTGGVDEELGKFPNPDVPVYTSNTVPRGARTRDGEKSYYDDDAKPTHSGRDYGRRRYKDDQIDTGGVDPELGMVEYGTEPVYKSNTDPRGARPRNGERNYYGPYGYPEPARTARDNKGYGDGYSEDDIDRQDGDRYPRRPYDRRDRYERSSSYSRSSISGNSEEPGRLRRIFSIIGISHRSKSVESRLEAAEYRQREDLKEQMIRPTFPGDIPRGERDRERTRAKSGEGQQRQVNPKFAAKMDTIDEEDDRRRSIGQMKHSEFESLIADVGTPGMFYYLVQRDNSPMWVLNLTAMQRMNIHVIQRDLVELASEIQRDGRLNVVSTSRWTKTQGNRLKTLMQDYCQAWRDWKLIDQYAGSRIEDDPFSLISTKELSFKLMKDAGLLDPSTLREIVDRGPDRVSDLLPGYSRHDKDRKKKSTEVRRRFFWGIGGGLALIGPMLIMRLHRTLLTQLVTAGVSVMLFALGVAVVSGGVIPGLDAIDLEPQGVLTAVAAYAAVLVVFISQGSG